MPYNINVPTKSKTSSSVQHINDLILKIQNKIGGQHVITDANIQLPNPNMNPTYDAENGGEKTTNAEDIISLGNPGENSVQQLNEVCF
jgi:hypothetical protein